MNRRISVVALVFILAFLATVGRLFFLQVIERTELSDAAELQQGVQKNVQSTRGTIFIRSHFSEENEYMPIAITRRGWDMYINPSLVVDEERELLMTKLPELTQLESAKISEILLKKDDPFEPLYRGADDDTASLFGLLNSQAIGKQQTLTRYYPSGAFASHVIGFVSTAEENKGQYGIEEYFNGELTGEKGFVKGFRNSFGALISALSDIDRPEDGADIYLTLDYNIQRTLEKHLKEAYEKYSSRSAQGIIVEPKTGRVLALASYPTFDPNSYSEAELSAFINPVVQNVYEPGSVFKPLTMAVALDVHVISPDMTYRDTGLVQVADATIKNSGGRVEGVQTMTQVLEKSLNTGAVFAAQKVPRGVWRDYIDRFGIGEKTDIELAGEVRGNIANVEKGGPVEIATSSFGQGISMTPLGLVMAISTLANDGILMKPYIVEKIVNEEDKIIYEGKPSERAQVISASTAETVTTMLVSVVEKGSGWGAKMNSHWVAGKTGTAQVASSSGGYSEEVNHTFVGYAPAFDPQFVMLLKLENPQGVEFSEASVGPLFKEIASFILNYYGTEPSKPAGNL